MRVLVVEDEKKTASFIRKALRGEGFAVDVCHNGDDGLHLAETTGYDALVLDIMLPGRDGLSVLRQLRERRNPVPVLLLSARGEVNERVEGLERRGRRLPAETVRAGRAHRPSPRDGPARAPRFARACSRWPTSPSTR